MEEAPMSQGAFTRMWHSVGKYERIDTGLLYP